MSKIQLKWTENYIDMDRMVLLPDLMPSFDGGNISTVLSITTFSADELLARNKTACEIFIIENILDIKLIENLDAENIYFNWNSLKRMCNRVFVRVVATIINYRYQLWTVMNTQVKFNSSTLTMTTGFNLQPFS